ncbi:kinesin-like protein KIF16B isoform X3 [Cephus cinctus]|uniref:Kinesin-like protein KIF16B isoform X3 n=1 Tax=Cephus cinctus TaxID=211228 RepID=A0AAJ7C7U0_CEPCN|nr:kinesin-like protein KIF16B isoform X3 [Cephus cinctus]
MSCEKSKPSTPHGFCNAIFASSSCTFGKENRPPRDGHGSNPELRTERDTRWQQTRRMFCSEEKLKTPSKSNLHTRLSSDKTPVTHFCTPRRVAPSNARTPMKRYFSDHSLTQSTPECFNQVQVETPRREIFVEEQTICDGENSNLTVGIRVRPLNLRELTEPKITSIITAAGQSVIVDCESSQHSFMYDHCFVSYSDSDREGHADQETVFRSLVLPLVQNAFEGYNACLFAYGQTGSGKSYSMMGVESGGSKPGPEAGIIPRFCYEIFRRAQQTSEIATSVEISYFEIYNEKIHDLLASDSGSKKKSPLKVREHPVFGPYVVDLSQHGVRSYDDLQAWLKVGNSQRVTAATGMNEKSSRSHSIFSVILTQTRIDVPEGKPVEPSKRSKINLVDLAGSERLSQTCASGDRLREGVSINKSLLTLGKVIGSLAESTSNRKRGFVPYRESVLTWLLKESLGGNSRTAMLGTVSPASIHLEETLATLRYACQARAIVNRVRINEDPHDRLIRELKAEVLRLRGVREGYERQLGNHPQRPDGGNEATEEVRAKEQEIENLREQLRKTEEQLCLTQNTIENNNGRLTLTPEVDSDTYVNGQIVTGKVLLKHGDRLVIGGNHYFRVCNPKDDNAQSSVHPTDFEFAHQEILRIQEEKLRAELEESKRKAIKELENAKKDVELQLGSQKLTFEREIQALGTTLERQKMALEEVNRRKKELELEKEIIASEMETNERVRKIQNEHTISGDTLPPYHSNFLAELEAILNETTADAETTLQLKCSNDAIKNGGVTLHEMQLLVREATERCRDVGINYEFNQQQVLTEKGLQPAIRIRDKDHNQETLWKPMRFLDWVHRLREFDVEDSLKVLRDVEDQWVTFDESEIADDSLNTSRISINMTPVRRQLNESLHQLSMDAGILEETGISYLKDDSGKVDGLQLQEAECLSQIEIAVQRLAHLCHLHESRETSGAVTKALDKVQSIVMDLRNQLDLEESSKEKQDKNEKSVHCDTKNAKQNLSLNDRLDQSSNDRENSKNNINEEKIEILNLFENFIDEDLSKKDTKSNSNESPSKSKSRGTCPHLKNSKTVQFNVQ